MSDRIVTVPTSAASSTCPPDPMEEYYYPLSGGLSLAHQECQSADYLNLFAEEPRDDEFQYTSFNPQTGILEGFTEYWAKERDSVLESQGWDMDLDFSGRIEYDANLDLDVGIDDGAKIKEINAEVGAKAEKSLDAKLEEDFAPKVAPVSATTTIASTDMANNITAEQFATMPDLGCDQSELDFDPRTLTPSQILPLLASFDLCGSSYTHQSQIPSAAQFATSGSESDAINYETYDSSWSSPRSFDAGINFDADFDFGVLEDVADMDVEMLSSPQTPSPPPSPVPKKLTRRKITKTGTFKCGILKDETLKSGILRGRLGKSGRVQKPETHRTNEISQQCKMYLTYVEQLEASLCAAQAKEKLAMEEKAKVDSEAKEQRARMEKEAKHKQVKAQYKVDQAQNVVRDAWERLLLMQVDLSVGDMDCLDDVSMELTSVHRELGSQLGSPLGSPLEASPGSPQVESAEDEGAFELKDSGPEKSLDLDLAEKSVSSALSIGLHPATPDATPVGSPQVSHKTSPKISPKLSPEVSPKLSFGKAEIPPVSFPVTLPVASPVASSPVASPTPVQVKVESPSPLSSVSPASSLSDSPSVSPSVSRSISPLVSRSVSPHQHGPHCHHSHGVPMRGIMGTAGISKPKKKRTLKHKPQLPLEYPLSQIIFREEDCSYMANNVVMEDPENTGHLQKRIGLFQGAEMSKLTSIERTRYLRDIRSLVALHHPGVTYELNEEFNPDSPYKHQITRTEIRNGYDVPDTRSALCPYCKELHFYELKNSTYAQHMSHVHGIFTDSYVAPNPIFPGRYRISKECAPGRKTMARVREHDGVVCPVCYEILEVRCWASKVNDKPLSNYLRHFKEKHRKKYSGKNFFTLYKP